MNPIATKLDQAKAAASGPYTVNGATVYSGAQFRMVGGCNQGNVAASNATLTRVAASVGLAGAVYSLQTGRGDPQALVKLTQALIDDGQLPKGTTLPLADQIHDLQWRFGIGMDCAGYVYRALVAAHGDPSKLGLKASAYENFTGLPSNPHFTRLGPSDARAGDVIVLKGSGRPDDPGHNLIVRSHSIAGESVEDAIKRWPAAATFARAGGAAGGALKPGLHVYEVDSSFGAGESGDRHGGVRRDVLLCDTSVTPPQWCTCRDTQPTVTTEGLVPYGEQALTGFFRAKVTP